MNDSPTSRSDTVSCNGELFDLYLPTDEIRSRVGELGATISDEYRGRVPIFVGVLNGAFLFMADLIRTLSIECEIDFLKLSSYGSQKISSGEVRQLKTIDASVTDRDVVIVEDIVDTGLSMKYIQDLFRERDLRSFRTCTLLRKPEALETDVRCEYVGFDIPDRFVIGYGMDYAQKGRNLPGIYIKRSENSS